MLEPEVIVYSINSKTMVLIAAAFGVLALILVFAALSEEPNSGPRFEMMDEKSARIVIGGLASLTGAISALSFFGAVRHAKSPRRLVIEEDKLTVPAFLKETKAIPMKDITRLSIKEGKGSKVLFVRHKRGLFAVAQSVLPSGMQVEQVAEKVERYAKHAKRC